MQRVIYGNANIVIADKVWDLLQHTFDVLDITGEGLTVELPAYLGDATTSTLITVRLVAHMPWISYADNEVDRVEDPAGSTNAINMLDNILQAKLRESKDVSNRLAQHGYFGH
jgi:hypothetical protein